MGEPIDVALKNLPQSAQVLDDAVPIGNAAKAAEPAAEVQGKRLNGAQTQSLMAIMAQYAAGELSEGQAIALISTAIGIDKDAARKILRGDLT